MRGGQVARAIGAGLVTCLFVLPIVFMISGSLREPGRPPPRTPELLPGPPTVEAYVRAFDLVDLGRHVANSLIVATLVAPLSVIVASLAGFALLHLSPRRARLLVAASVFALMVPLTAVIVPRFVIFSQLSLTDSWIPLIAPALLGMSPLYVLLFAWAFRRIPSELYDICRLEAMTPFAIWWRVAMPLVKPVTAAVAVLAFVTSWGSLLEPLVYLYDPDLYTLPLGLRALAELDRTDAPVLLAGSVIATAPVVLVFVVAQRWLLGERSMWWLA